MKLRTLLIASFAALISASLAVFAQQPGVNNNFPIFWQMVWEASTTKPTYSATQANITAVASQTDQCTLTGSATKTVRVRKIIFTNLPTTAVTEPIAIVKRSTANTGAGTALPKASYDSQNATTTVALAETWTAAPTVGTLAGTIADIIAPFAVSTGANTPVVFTFGANGESALVLRGIAQSVSINLNATTFTGTVGCTFVWTEVQE